MNNIKENIMKEIEQIREYSIPSSDSLTASSWLNSISENKDTKNQNIISAKAFLSSLSNFGYIKGNPNGEGYVPTKKCLNSGLFEVKENYRTSSNNELIQTCTILFTTKGQDELKPIVLKLIDIKNSI